MSITVTKDTIFLDLNLGHAPKAFEARERLKEREAKAAQSAPGHRAVERSQKAPQTLEHIPEKGRLLDIVA